MVNETIPHGMIKNFAFLLLAFVVLSYVLLKVGSRVCFDEVDL